VPEPDPILATFDDPLGRPVTLTAGRWEHIVRGHPELSDLREAVLETVRHPSRHLREPRPAEDWYYRAGMGPSRWLKVVVTYSQGRGLIVTAFARRRTP
jgi:hypothetical protein